MKALEVLEEAATPEIAGLCSRAMNDAPSEHELRDCLFAPGQPTVVRGDPAVGVVATTSWNGCGFVRLLAVDPAHRGRGHGRSLLAAAEADLSAFSSITVGADAPYWLFPGVETDQVEMLCLLERMKYQRVDANFNMTVDLTRLPPDPGGTALASAAEETEVAGWTETHWPNWKEEVLRALGKSKLVIARDEVGMVGFCAYDVNRNGLLGPVALRWDLIGRGAGRPLLLAALHRMAADGRDEAEVAWVGPVVPYARVGGRVGRVFFVYRKDRQ